MTRSVAPTQILLAALILLTLSSSALAQDPKLPATREQAERREISAEGERIRREYNRGKVELNRPLNPVRERQTGLWTQPYKYPWSARERKLLAPPEDVKRAYAAFLHEPETGIFHILPAGKYEQKGVVSVDELKTAQFPISIAGAGAYYSFSKKRHYLDEWSDLGLNRDADTIRTSVSGTSLGLLTLLGDTPLEALTLEHPALDYLLRFVPPASAQEIVREAERGVAGFKVGQYLYRADGPALVNTTYVLRSINYPQSDQLVAFRVVRQDSDGSLTVLWKRLKKFPKPALKKEVEQELKHSR